MTWSVCVCVMYKYVNSTMGTNPLCVYDELCSRRKDFSRLL